MSIKDLITRNSFLYTIAQYILYWANQIFNYKVERKKFKNKLGYKLNLDNPKSFNEKTIWKKINDRNPLLPVTADKYKVRDYIKKVLGEEKAKEILIPQIFVTNNPEEIPFEDLPKDFIIKANHASGWNIIVEDSDFNKNKIIEESKRWLKTPYGLGKLEWAYQKIDRKIVIEKLLKNKKGELPKDYKFFCIDGMCKLIRVFFKATNSSTATCYDRNWNELSIETDTYSKGPKLKKPIKLNTMLNLAEELSSPFDFARIDFYFVNQKIYFGEITHYSLSGRIGFIPRKFDFELGKYWQIRPKYWENNG